MVKYISKIINKILFTFVIFNIIGAVIFIFWSTYQSLSIINAPLKKGVIIDVEIQTGIGRETHSYRAFGYTIQIENEKYYSTNSISTKYKIGDVVRGYIRGEKSFILTEVNGVRVGNRYRFQDYIYFILSLLIILIIIYRMKFSKVVKYADVTTKNSPKR